MLAAVIGSAAIAAAATAGRTRRFAVVEDSMLPALGSGDWLIAVRRRGVPSRGDVVIFTLPADPHRFLIKRVLGLPGERVSISEGQVHVDGATLAESWAHGPTFPEGDEVVAEDAVWVLGDNRGLSTQDSRTVGSIPLGDVGWRVVAVYWPAARVGLV